VCVVVVGVIVLGLYNFARLLCLLPEFIGLLSYFALCGGVVVGWVVDLCPLSWWWMG